MDCFDIKKDNVDEIIEFIIESKEDIISKGHKNENIIVCVPRYFIRYLEGFNSWFHVKNNTDKPSNEIAYLTGLKCQISYENSVTVFLDRLNTDTIIKYTKQL